MRKKRRLSNEAAKILEIFARDAQRQAFGLEVLGETGVGSGSLYPCLHRFEADGLLRSQWESLATATAEGRRPRRLYQLDPAGADKARGLLDEWRAAQSSVATASRGPVPRVA